MMAPMTTQKALLMVTSIHLYVTVFYFLLVCYHKREHLTLKP
jgi:hypothetical protein